MDNNMDVRAVVTRNAKDLPLVLTPMEVAVILGISRNKAYELMHQEGFPSFKVDKWHYKIHRDKFLKWLDDASDRNAA